MYEIAKIKSEDPPLALMTLEQICQMMVGIAKSVGIKIVRDLDANEYKEFLIERAKVVAEEQQKLQEIREAKLLRTA